MKKYLLLSAMGRDRVGVADDLAAALAYRRIGIEDSRWTALRGRFALVAQVGGAEDDVMRLRRELTTLRAELGFDIELAPIEAARAPQRAPDYVIETFSSGPSEMSAVTAVLKRYDVNIEQLQTDTSGAPFTSEITFHMKALISLPPSCSKDALREELRVLERERELDIVISPGPSWAGERKPTATT